MKRFNYLIFTLLFFLGGILFSFQSHLWEKEHQSDVLFGQPQQEVFFTKSLSVQMCLAVKKIYERGFFNSEIQQCISSSGEQYFMIQKYGIEGGSGREFFDINGNGIGEIGQYGGGDGTMPEKATVSGRILNGLCQMINLKECGVIDLVTSYWGKKGLIEDSEYAKTCENTLKKFGLDPRHQQSPEGDSTRRDLSHRYFMCTNDSEIFYIGFTGDKIGSSRTANYKNFNTIEYFNLQGDSLGLTKSFQLKTNGDQLHGIDIADQKAPYKIQRCIYMPIYDCYEK